MKFLMICSAIVAFAPAPLLAQDNGAAMAEVIRQMRETANQMEGSLSAEEIAEMRRSADELERENGKGAFRAPPPRVESWDVAGRIAAEHGGKVDWLDQRPACVGYGWENYRTFRLQSGDRDAERDILCRRAFGHYADHMAKMQSGDFAGARASLDAYDKAAHAAVDFFERGVKPAGE